MTFGYLNLLKFINFKLELSILIIGIIYKLMHFDFETGDRLLVRYKSPKKESNQAFDVKQSEVFEFEATLTYISYVVDQVIARKITLPFHSAFLLFRVL